MLDNIILGTANFTQQYGILSSGLLCKSEVKKILETSSKNGVLTLDTAFAYGDIFCDYLKEILKKFTMNTKFSLKDDLESVSKKLRNLSSVYKIDVLMVHDPQYIKNIDHKKLKEFIRVWKEEKLVNRVGVSVYEEINVYQFASLICNPEVIQIPLNPLNQAFNSNGLKQFALDNKIEIHARSLFLQGVFLSKNIPEKLLPLKNKIESLRKALASCPSILSGLLAWAKQQEWVHKWVVGVSSVSNFNEICLAATNMWEKPINFISSNHTLLDPRTW